MKAIAGTVCSAAATVLYSIICILFLVHGPFLFSLSPSTLGEFIVTLLLNIAFLPFVVFFQVLSVIVACVLALATVLVATGKTVAGGILMILFSLLGFVFALIWWFVPLVLGIAGGILAFNRK